MGIIKNSFVFIGIGLFSVSCFAAQRFYCPDPSNLHAQSFGSDSYKYVGTNEIGIVFSSDRFIFGDIKKAPGLKQFYKASVENEVMGQPYYKSGSCNYRDKKNKIEVVHFTTSQFFSEVGKRWGPKVQSSGLKKGSASSYSYNECNSKDRKYCAFEFISNK